MCYVIDFFSLCGSYRGLASCSLRPQMVYDFVEERQGLDMLRDKRVIAATADIGGVAVSKAEVWHASPSISK